MFKKYLSKKYLAQWLIVGGFLLLVVAGALWWCKLSVTSERVFWGMIEQSFASSGVTMSTTNQQGEATVEQHLQYSLGAQNLALASTTLTQAGAIVTTETVGSLGADYTRYARIQTERTSSNGGPLDLSNVLNVWAKTEQPAGSSQLLSQTILGMTMPLGSIPVPIGNLTSEQRESLMKQIKDENVYEVSYNNVKKEKKNGRLYYTYEVKIQLIPYVHLVKEFAKSIGLHDLDQLDPNQYQGEPMTVQMTVDARAKQLTEVFIPDMDFRQTFSAYDIPVSAQVPEQSIPAQELQQRLQEL